MVTSGKSSPREEKIIPHFLKKGIAFSEIHATMKIRYVHNVHHIQDFGGKTMAYNITDACVACGSCAEQCPVEAISEGDGKYEINPDICVSCGSCAEQCPAEAIEEV